MTATDKETDLFGEPITGHEGLPQVAGKRKPTVPKGYAAPPGTGPKGETCKTCVHICRRSMGKTYLKCGLAETVGVSSYRDRDWIEDMTENYAAINPKRLTTFFPDHP